MLDFHLQEIYGGKHVISVSARGTLDFSIELALLGFLSPREFVPVGLLRVKKVYMYYIKVQTLFFAFTETTH